jgi:hypothetical protein
MATHKDGKTRRSILIEVAAAATAVSGGATMVQAQAAARRVEDKTVRKILAVAVGGTVSAVGDSDRAPLDIDKNTSSTDLATVRPYITGLIEWLNDPTKNTDLDAAPKTFPLGDTSFGYTIAYREITMANLNVEHPNVFSSSNLKEIDCIVCMSTFVGEKAADSTTDIPIVVITSDPSNKKFGGSNVCGVCAMRPQLTSGLGLHEFKKKSGLSKLYGLNRADYNPSDQAKKSIGKGIPSSRWVNVNDKDTGQSILDQIQKLNKTNAGLLVMPADRFFGMGDQIVMAAAPMPTFWSTTDWPKTLKGGGYGYPQSVCGQYMAQRIASIWSTSSGIDIPDEPFLTVDPKYVASVYKS